MIHLETERMILRDYVLTDLEEYSRLKTDPDTMFYLQDIMLHTFAEAEEDLKQILLDASSEKRQFYFLHMEEKNTGETIGSIGYDVTEWTDLGKLVHLGYFTYPKFWGKGYTTEALKELLSFAFKHNDVYRIATGCLSENIGSERVMQKCGFIKEAEHLESEWHDGQLKTRVEYRLLCREYNSFRL